MADNWGSGVNSSKVVELTPSLYTTEVQVTAATTLAPNQRKVHAVIPLATADDFAITLPPLTDVEHGGIIFIRFTRATGSYVDGTVTVQDGDESVTALAVTGFANAADYIAVMNVYGLQWVVLEDIVAGS